MTALAKYEGGGLATADEWSRDRIDLIKRTYCKGATDDELAMFINACQRTGLSPEARQIYGIKRYDSSVRAEVLRAEPSIDGFRLIAERSGKWAGTDDPLWCGPDGQWVDVWLKADPPAAAKVSVRRHDWQVPRTGIALFTEYAQTKKDGGLTNMWATKPALMLAKCAEAAALRSAFPVELSGLYTPDEMGQSENVVAPASPPPRAIPARAEVVGEGDPFPSVDPETGEIKPTRTKRKPPTVSPPAPVLATVEQRQDVAGALALVPDERRVELGTAWKAAGIESFKAAERFTPDDAEKALSLIADFMEATS